MYILSIIILLNIKNDLKIIQSVRALFCLTIFKLTY